MTLDDIANRLQQAEKDLEKYHDALPYGSPQETGLRQALGQLRASITWAKKFTDTQKSGNLFEA